MPRASSTKQSAVRQHCPTHRFGSALAAAVDDEAVSVGARRRRVVGTRRRWRACRGHRRPQPCHRVVHVQVVQIVRLPSAAERVNLGRARSAHERRVLVARRKHRRRACVPRTRREVKDERVGEWAAGIGAADDVHLTVDVGTRVSHSGARGVTDGGQHVPETRVRPVARLQYRVQLHASRADTYRRYTLNYSQVCMRARSKCRSHWTKTIHNLSGLAQDNEAVE